MSAKRRAALAAQGITRQSSTLTTSPAKKTRPAGTGPDQPTVDGLLLRDEFTRLVGGYALHGKRAFDYSVHHRKLRSQGGDNSPSNLIAVCGHGTAGCHGRIHANPKWAKDNGYIVRRDEDPWLKPVAHALHGVVYLNDAGGWTTHRPEVKA